MRVHGHSTYRVKLLHILHNEQPTSQYANPLEGNKNMSAYIVVQVQIHDLEKFAAYRQMVPPTLKAYGGRYLVRGGDWKSLEGTWNPQRLVIIEFDSVDQAKNWWSSKEYAPAKQLRENSTNSKMIVVEGYED